MTRITNSLFESIRQVTHPVIAEAKVEGKDEKGGKAKQVEEGSHYGNEKLANARASRTGTSTVRDQNGKGGVKTTTTKTPAKVEEGGRVDGAHYCATHVEHSLYGNGECISEQHAKPNEDGTIDWYNVKFADGQVRKIQTDARACYTGRRYN